MLFLLCRLSSIKNQKREFISWYIYKPNSINSVRFIKNKLKIYWYKLNPKMYKVQLAVM